MAVEPNTVKFNVSLNIEIFILNINFNFLSGIFDNTVTFYYEDATIDLPTFDMGHSGDIYLQFKTTAENGVLVHSIGPTDYIKVMLVGK